MLPTYLSYGRSVTIFHCRYLTSKHVPIPPLGDQIFTPKIRQTDFETNGKIKNFQSRFFNTESFMKIWLLLPIVPLTTLDTYHHPNFQANCMYLLHMVHRTGHHFFLWVIWLLVLCTVQSSYIGKNQRQKKEFSEKFFKYWILVYDLTPTSYLTLTWYLPSLKLGS